MRTRLAKKEDLGEIFKILRPYYNKEYKPFKMTMKMLKEKFFDQKNNFIVGVDKNKVIGVIRIVFEDIDLVELRWACVKVNYRRKGIGASG